MPENGQMGILISKAQEKLARKGVPNDPDNVSDADVILAGFGWLAEQMKPTRPVLGTKTQTGAILAALAAGVIAFLKAMGWGL